MVREPVVRQATISRLVRNLREPYIPARRRRRDRLTARTTCTVGRPNHETATRIKIVDAQNSQAKNDHGLLWEGGMLMMLCTTMVHNIVRDVAGGGVSCGVGSVVWWGQLCGGGGCLLFFWVGRRPNAPAKLILI